MGDENDEHKRETAAITDAPQEEFIEQKSVPSQPEHGAGTEEGGQRSGTPPQTKKQP